MKKYVTISLFIFWAITVAVIVAGLISYNKTGNQAITGSNANSNNPVDSTVGVGSSVTNLILSPTELAKHNSANSCWLLISGKIYDVTSFINQHPGGDMNILRSCGTDATQAYNTKGGRGNAHSGNANAMLADYYIGNLNQKINTTSANSSSSSNTSKTNTPVNNSVRRSSDNEFDD